MRHLLHRLFPVKTRFPKISRSYLAGGLLLVALAATLACGPAAAPTAPPPLSPTPQPSPTPTQQMVTEPAPVESVAIEVTASNPVTAELVMVTGLPSGCVEFNSYTLEREGDTFQVTVTNLRPADQSIPCTMIYGMHTTRAVLPGDIVACETYTVVVNGEPFSARAEGPAVTCEAEIPMREERAPIENVTIEVQATDPLRASMVVVSGLPNACYSLGSYHISREGDTFQVEIINLVPDDPNLACAEVYGTVTTNIALTEDIEVCRTYTVNINDETHQVQAIAPNVRCENGAGGLGMGVTVGVGESAGVVLERLQVTLLEVTEDSRCPSDAICVQAGQATVVIKVEKDGDELGTLTLTLGESVGSVPQAMNGYTFRLARLDPHPVTTLEIQPEDYVAHVVVDVGPLN